MQPPLTFIKLEIWGCAYFFPLVSEGGKKRTTREEKRQAAGASGGADRPRLTRGRAAPSLPSLTGQGVHGGTVRGPPALPLRPPGPGDRLPARGRAPLIPRGRGCPAPAMGGGGGGRCCLLWGQQAHTPGST